MTSTTPAKDYPYDRTNLEGWRLVVSEDSHGQHKWIYLGRDDPRRETWEQSQPAKYWLDLDLVGPSSRTRKPSQRSFQLECFLKLSIGSSRVTGAEDTDGSCQERVRVL
jgi:hypothetical protein